MLAQTARIETGDLQQPIGNTSRVERLIDVSPRLTARLAGVFFLLTIVTGIVAQMYISGRLVVEGDAATTATNIATHTTLFQLGLTVYLIEMACQITLTVLMYILLRPVSGGVAFLAASFGLIGCAIKTLSRLFYIAPLLALGGAPYLSVFSVAQLQALGLLFLNINDVAAGMALVFYGFSDLLNGYLMLRSTFLPRMLGVVMIVGGLGWLAFLYPPLADRLFPYILAVALVGSVVQIVWFLVFGVNVQRWQELAHTR